MSPKTLLQCADAPETLGESRTVESDLAGGVMGSVCVYLMERRSQKPRKKNDGSGQCVSDEHDRLFLAV